MFRLLRHALGVARGPALSLVSVVAVIAVIEMVIVYAGGVLVGQVPGVVRDGWTAAFGWSLAGMVVLLFAQQSLPVLRWASETRLRDLLWADVSERAAEFMAGPHMVAHLESTEVLDDYRRATGQVGQSVDTGVTMAAVMLGSRLRLLGAAALVAVLASWWLAVAAVAATVAAERRFVKIARREQNAWHGGSEGHRSSEYLFELALGPAAKEQRVFGLGGWLTGRQQQVWADAIRPLVSARYRGIPEVALVMGALGAVSAGAVWYTAERAAAGSLSLSATTSAVGALLVIATSLSSGLVASMKFGNATLSALLGLPERIAGANAAPTKGTEAPDGLDGFPAREIRFERVVFGYPGREEPVLDGLDLTIRAGEALALVGVNGAGKSTLVKLLTGGYRPRSGRILVDGVDLAALSPAAMVRWQRRIAAIVQDFLVLPVGAAENVALTERPDPADVESAAVRAGADGPVDRLPARWDTPLDATLEGGTGLSGGEWQRIALARALYAVRQGAGVLVLDEPASALDVRAEAALVERYLELTDSVTSLIISHRFSVVRDADRIVVLDGGKITESGTHGELMAAGGRYAAMFRAQAARYAEQAAGAGPEDGSAALAESEEQISDPA